jgi:RimJ/RimL family protein N-acetyltransferase
MFERFGIQFKRLQEADLEQMRVWRNSDAVRPFMDYRKIITAEEHARWFQTINNAFNYYFIAYCDSNPFGVYNIKNIDPDQRCGEAGVFMISPEYWGKELASRGSLGLGVFAFEILKLEKLTAKIMTNNSKAINFNLQIGLKKEHIHAESEFVIMSMDGATFFQKNKRLIDYLNSRKDNIL